MPGIHSALETLPHNGPNGIEFGKQREIAGCQFFLLWRSSRGYFKIIPNFLIISMSCRKLTITARFSELFMPRN
jgi:hypothetical protein